MPLRVIDPIVTNRRYPASSTPPVNPIRGYFWTEIDGNGDLVQEWFWNGTYWLSSQTHFFEISDTSVGTNTVNFYFAPPRVGEYNLFLLNYFCSYRFTGTSDANNKINLTFRRNNFSNTNTVISIFDSTGFGDVPNTNYRKVNVLNLHQDPNALEIAQYIFTRQISGTISPTVVSQKVSYRLARI
jgi:hypothetical protein